ncbi:MAG: GntG family PLP-dependent aldolase [Phycisphaerales bacterium]|nr:GntG family PLP-dependent aldolase [Phycisphaerales bacterium]
MIDLRSDTVTRPTDAMRTAMAAAIVGDDVLGDDPTVNALQERCAAMFGKDRACFVPTGTMANQLAIRSQTEPGDGIIVHSESHIVHYETGAAAALAGCTFLPATGPRGQFESAELERLVPPDDDHLVPARLLVVENTHNRGGGSIWPIQQVVDVCETARKHELRTHLDGARIWNASVATGIPPSEWASGFDTVSACFSKGLGCPAGSIVAGDEKTMRRVFRFRKMYGGTMRQTGILAAAANHALEHHIDRLVEDHAAALQLAAGLNALPGLSCDLQSVETNLVFVDLDPNHGSGPDFCRELAERGVLAEALDPQRIRFVTHLDITPAMIDHAIAVMAEVLGGIHAS